MSACSCDLRERRGVGAGHPSLHAELLQLAIERGAARRVEMRDDLIQQQHRCKARHFRQQPRMRQHQADEQRLLLAGRGFGGGDALACMDDGEIGEVRAVERASGGGVARAIVAQGRTVAILHLDGRVKRAPAVPSSRRARWLRRERPRPGLCERQARLCSRSTVSTRSAVTATASSAVSCSIASSQCGSGRGSSSRRLRERSARSSALTRDMCSASTASTSRSRNRRRSEAGPLNNPSMAGTSQTTRR